MKERKELKFEIFTSADERNYLIFHCEINLLEKPEVFCLHWNFGVLLSVCTQKLEMQLLGAQLLKKGVFVS